MAYKSHKPYVQLSMMDKWYADLGPNKQQKDIILKTSIADTGAHPSASSLAAIISVAWDWTFQASSSQKST
jgi:hypothetical protein